MFTGGCVILSQSRKALDRAWAGLHASWENDLFHPRKHKAIGPIGDGTTATAGPGDNHWIAQQRQVDDTIARAAGPADDPVGAETKKSWRYHKDVVVIVVRSQI